MSYYAGVMAFRGYLRRVFRGSHPPYDWADLAESERKHFAEREASPRERRREKRS